MSFDDLQASGIKLIELSELQSDYINTKVTYQIKDKLSLFLSSDGGKTYKSLTSGVDYEWTSSDVFYQGTASYAEIEDNEAFFGVNGTNPEYVAKDETEISFKELLSRKILEGIKVTIDGKTEENDVTPIYTTVKFVNTGSDPLYIDADVVRSILYPSYRNYTAANVTTTTLDLGAATLNDLDEKMFIPSTGDTYFAGRLNISDVTFPKTKLTNVYSEKSKQNENKMILPANLLSYVHTKIKSVTIPEGYDRIADNAFAINGDLTNLTTVNLPKGLSLIGKKAFFGCRSLTDIVLNEGLENIGEEAFEGCKIKELKFPSSLKIINDGAFYNVEVTNLKLNAGLEYIGNSALGLDHHIGTGVETVIEIPASVKYMGPAAFDNRTYQDVYFYGAKAPLMPLGDSKYNAQSKNVTAFSAESLMGNGGFEKGDPHVEGDLKDNAAQGYANRENYRKRDTGVYFCILHFPKDLTPDQQAAYSDITREYKTVEEGQTFYYGKTDGNSDTYYTAGQEETPLKWNNKDIIAAKNLDYGFQDTYLGRQYVWPSQEAWLRSYIVSSNGYNWNGVTPYRPELTADDLATLEYAGYKQADVTDVEKGEYTLDDLQKIAHLGTRQFVLANADVNADDKPDEEPEYKIDLKPGQWWTLCVPFNMTKKQVLETFGSDTQLYFFYEVDRHTTNGKNSILLKFTKDALNNSSTDGEGKKMKGEDGKWEYDQMESGTVDDEVVIWAHESYMIKPMKGVNSDKEPTFVVKNYAPVVGNPLPTVVNAKGDDQLQDDDYSKEYRFIGNYLGSTDNNKVVIPQYSYVYGKTAKDPTYKFRFYTGKTSVWKPNKSLVQSHDRQGGLLDYNNFFGADKSSTLPQSAKQASIFGEENFGETTGIDGVTIIAGNEVLTPIFTLDGKMVSANGSVDGLAKGVYVKAGKKFVVK